MEEFRIGKLNTSPTQYMRMLRTIFPLALAASTAESYAVPRGSFGRAVRASRVGGKVSSREASRMLAEPSISPFAQNVMDFNKNDPGAFTACILGDLHLDPRYTDDVVEGRGHFKSIIEDAQSQDLPVAVCSLGDLGESKACDVGIGGSTSELFAGTTRCHEFAADFLRGFGVPYEVVGGNHDLEGIDEFMTDEENLAAYLKAHDKALPQFCRQIADKTLLVGLGSTSFRDAKYTSHEVTVDDEQIAWFEDLVRSHTAEDGWKVFVFSHAPPMGAGLRVLQKNHVVNGCCWLNHSGGDVTKKYINLVRENKSIKAWFSGHFHLGQDYEDSITFPAGNNRGSCVFVQTAVMREGSTRDGRRQSRLVRGTTDGFEILTVNHAKDGAVRLDATISYPNAGHGCEVVVAHPSEDYDHDKFFSAYTPSDDDGCEIVDVDGKILDDAGADGVVCWFRLKSGVVLGLHEGMIVEYDQSTLAPLGLVVAKDELAGRKVAVVDSGLDAECEVSEEVGMEGADCVDQEAEQAVILYDEAGSVTVVQPNEDGSYWRKIVRNKMIRMKEQRREKAAKRFIAEELGLESPTSLVSSWGPYVTTSGTAKNTGVQGLTTKSSK